MAHITISHTREDGTTLDGSRKGDGVYEIVAPRGFRFSRNVGIYIRGSRDKEAQHWRINGAADALRAAGHTVEIEIDEEDNRSFAEIEAAREERAEERAERFDDRAGRAAAESDARRGRAKDISRRFEFGQPILVGHHSERRARRDQQRMDDNMRASIDATKKAGYWAGRAEAAGAYKEYRNNPYRTLRRLEKLRAELREQERHIKEATEKGWDSLDRHERLARDMRKEIEHWEEVVEKAKADGVKIWTADDFAPGDYAYYLGSWYQVKRVNPKTLSVAWNLRLARKPVMTLEDATERGQVWTHPADYTKVRARCPEAAMAAFLADGKVPSVKGAYAASEEQPAAAVREALAAKPKPKAKAGAKKSDPKVPKKVYVSCELGGAEATLTWLNGNSRPQKGWAPVRIEAGEEKFNRAIWTRALQERIAELLAAKGYEVDGTDWQLSRDRTGFVRPIKAKVEPEPAPEPEQPEEAPGADGDATEGSKRTALTSDFSGNTRNRQTSPSVGNSDYPLNPTNKEDPVSARTTHTPDGKPRPTRREQKAAQMAEMAAKAAERPEVERTDVLDAAYRAYVDEGIASTDGWYAPLDFQAWATTLGAPLVAAAAGEAETPAEEPEPKAAPEPAEEAPAEPEPKPEPTPAPDPEPATPAKKEPARKPRKTAAKAPAKDPVPAKKTVEPTTVRKRREVHADTVAEAKAKAPTHKRVPIDRIDRDPSQPRQVFDQTALEELAGSMKRLGQLQPVSLRYVPSTKRYVLVMGERRWRAAQIAQLTELDAVVAHGIPDGDRETLARQVAENCGRADMTPVEEAESFKRLVDAEYSIDEVSEMVGKSPAYVGWRIDLLRLCDTVREALSKGHIPVGLAWYVSLLNTDNQMRFLTRYTRGEFKSTRDAEAFAQAARAEEKRVEEQGSFFVLADEAAAPKNGQEALPGSLDLPESEREKIVADRTKLTGRIDKLSVAGEILSELANADPETLALLLAGTPGGVPGHAQRIEHLRELTLRAQKNLRQAQAIAAVRASSIQINPEAAATSAA
ncbi:ParB/RepB/Spo0J family partition protein [Streptomyces roseolus]|uniref:ParB/RepB/Spo0J family partition protein n=1 Tax=Streptomyces roseolus TaxID=67358 RepID=UPI00378B705F